LAGDALEIAGNLWFPLWQAIEMDIGACFFWIFEVSFGKGAEKRAGNQGETNCKNALQKTVNFKKSIHSNNSKKLTNFHSFIFNRKAVYQRKYSGEFFNLRANQKKSLFILCHQTAEKK
jgi:hypothetical protein